jgi:hypothetical protein
LLERRLPALAAPTYRRFIAAAFVGNVGLWMQATAQGWLVLELTGSPAMLGLVGALATLPTLLLSLPAGVLADRFDRRRPVATLPRHSRSCCPVTTAGVVVFWQVLPWPCWPARAGLATPRDRPLLVDRRSSATRRPNAAQATCRGSSVRRRGGYRRGRPGDRF